MDRIGAKIRELREDYGLGVDDLALLAGLESDRLSAIEAGGALSTWELARVADGLAVDPGVMVSGDLPRARRSVARFRAQLGLEAPRAADVRLLARAQQVGRVVGELACMIGRPRCALVEAREPCAVGAQQAAWRQGYQLGQAARSALRIPAGPVSSMQGLLEHLGVHVALVVFEGAGIEGASLVEAGSAPVVLLNARASRVRHRHARRAVLAHELCHLLHDGGERDLLTVVSRPDDESPAEQRANGFAPSFLAPGPELGLRSTTLPELVVELAEGWGLSFEGAVWHGKNLGLVSEDEARHLLGRAPKPRLDLGFESEPVRSDPHAAGLDAQPSALVRGLLSDLVVEAAKDELISAARAREILWMS